MKTAQKALLWACVAVCGSGVATHASAYRTTQDTAQAQRQGITGKVAWTTFPVPFSLNQAGSADIQDFAATEAAVQRAYGTWAEQSCTSLTIDYRGPTSTGIRSGDGNNVVAWVESGWANQGFPASAIGVTNVMYGTRNGRSWYIPESDMSLNGVNFTWVIEGGSGGSSRVDVQGIVVHEAGHFFGIQHPCEFGGQDGAPSCTMRPNPATEATMFPAYLGMDARSLAQDDIDAICFLYPGSGPPPDAGPAPQPDAGMSIMPNEDAGSTRPTAGLGDTCGSSAECVSNLCAQGGGRSFCTQTCGTCPSGFECVAVDANTSVCNPLLAGIGGTCTESAQCLSNLCVTAGARQYCTRTCDDASPCNTGFSCQPTSSAGVNVCAPTAAAPRRGGCGCQVPGAPGQGLFGLALGLALFVALRGRRRR